MQLQGEWMTAGHFADKAGVTKRTIQFYDKVGLLSPSHRTSTGHRYYTKQDLARLQRILTLKYIGMTIDEIRSIIHQDGHEVDLKESLRLQSTIIGQKMEHLRLVQKTVKETLSLLESLEQKEQESYGHNIGFSESSPAWDLFASIIRVVNQEYESAFNLQTRIRLHDDFSVNTYKWHHWLFDKMIIPESSTILELGCGDAALWKRNADRIPEGWDITLTDLSDGMLNDAREGLKHCVPPNRFRFSSADARSIPFPDASFDVILANHMLYHVTERHQSLKEIYRVLKPGGILISSTMGKHHMLEVKEFLSQINPNYDFGRQDFACEFGLENGADQLNAVGFVDIRLERYEDALKVTGAQPLIDYIRTTPGGRENLTDSRLAQLEIMLKEQIDAMGNIHITKEVGVFFAFRK
ncbi:MerR family transcriptional regulator [Paenibacillus nasutitermitis]|uniref:MerR family transcriptional regulator n=1 Tax=Paenibacillus nasutitermitis TaxID=1652958 RepID=A0A916ZKV4_9BACL|nr:methyltransferase domain-containing protein [Paenibacillus nasutitermitis]GGE02581.1 MerR family transcriptional regulator [Paenibacillus nasutitermitis]